MTKATIVYGPRNSGKSTLIEKMMKDYKNPLHTDYHHFMKGSILSSFMGVEKNTDVVVIHMPPQVEKLYLFEHFFHLIGGKLEVHKQSKESFAIDTPKLIFEVDYKPTFPGLSEGYVNSKFDFIECKGEDNQELFKLKSEDIFNFPNKRAIIEYLISNIKEFEYIGDLCKENGFYFFNVHARINQEVCFENKVYEIVKLDYCDIGCYLKLKIEANFLESCVK